MSGERRVELYDRISRVRGGVSLDRHASVLVTTNKRLGDVTRVGSRDGFIFYYLVD